MLYDFQFNIYGQRKKKRRGGRGTIEDEEKKKDIEIELDKVE